MPAALTSLSRRRRHGLWVVGLLLALPSSLLWTADAHARGAELCAGYAGCSAGQFTSHGYGAHVDTSYWEMSAGDECTNYAAYVESTVYDVPAPGYILGDGGDWAATAAAHGVTVDHTPSVGAVAEWDDGSAGIAGDGHVAVVEAVGPGGRWIEVSQQHVDTDADGYDWERIDARRPAADAWEPWPNHFIHFAGGTPLADGAVVTSFGFAGRIAGAPALRSRR